MNIYRTTQGSMSRLLTSELGQLTTQIRKTETQAITGLRYNRPSDGPAEVATAIKLQGVIDDQAEFEDNINRALSFQSSGDDALAQASEIFKRAKEIAVAGASEGYDATSRSAMAVEVQGLSESLLAVANTRIGERYIFAGENYDGEAFDATFTYQGGNNSPETRIASNLWTETGWDGSEVFQGTVDTFQVLEDVAAALDADDPDTVFALLSDLEDAFNQLSAARQQVGHEQKMTEDAEETAGNIHSILVAEYNAIAQIDEAETYTRLNELQQSYNAALQVGAASSTGKLFEYL